jgi:hypothetical protein
VDLKFVRHGGRRPLFLQRCLCVFMLALASASLASARDIALVSN